MVRKPWIAWFVLGCWLLGGVVWPLLHQLAHEHTHHHGRPYRLVYSADGRPDWIAISGHHSHAHSHHKHHKHHHHEHAEHSHHKYHKHHSHHSLLSRVVHWLGHVWRAHHGHHADHAHRAHQPVYPAESGDAGDGDDAETATDTVPFDPMHGEGSLAHFDLLNQTSVSAYGWLAGLPPTRPFRVPFVSVYRAEFLLSWHRPRAPPAA